MEDQALSNSPSDYADRPGYQATFLGTANVVALPSVVGDRADDVMSIVGGGRELRYWTYSVLMSRSRRLPILSATNFDRNSKTSGKRPDLWRYDPRLDSDPTASASMQTGEAWYAKHSSAVLGTKSFDKGHLTAFENAECGLDPVRNGLDTFHYTNCAPQASAFNEHKIWREIEVWAAAQGESGKLLIFNGCVFDAPISTPLPSLGPLGNHEFQLNPLGPGSPDPVLGGVAVPKQFFKVAAYPQQVGLTVQSFVVTQEDYLAAEVETLLAPDAAELRLYRVPLSVVSHLTGIDFGPLAAETKSLNDVVADDIRLIRSEDDLAA